MKLPIPAHERPHLDLYEKLAKEGRLLEHDPLVIIEYARELESFFAEVPDPEYPDVLADSEGEPVNDFANAVGNLAERWNVPVSNNNGELAAFAEDVRRIAERFLRGELLGYVGVPTREPMTVWSWPLEPVYPPTSEGLAGAQREVDGTSGLVAEIRATCAPEGV